MAVRYAAPLLLLLLCALAGASARADIALWGSEAKAHRADAAPLESHVDVEALTPVGPAEKLELPAGVVVADDPDPSISDIVRIGEEVWKIVEDNKGVINYDTDYTGAIPRAAAKDPFVMSGWKNQDFTGWRWQLVNGYNSTVVDLQWGFKANSNGQYKGQGHFLNDVQVVLSDIYAAWGFTVDVKAAAGDPYNMGTVGAPIAAQELQVTMEVTTALDQRVQNCRVRFFGDGRPAQCIECAFYC